MAQIIVRSGTTADRMGAALQPAELFYDTTLDQTYVGDGITPGGFVPERPVAAGALVEADVFSDFVVSGLLTPVPSSSLIGIMTPGVCYAIGERVVKLIGDASLTFTYAVNSDTYDDISNAGVITHVAVANGATAPAVTANSLRLQKVVTSATAVTSVINLQTQQVGVFNGIITSIFNTTFSNSFVGAAGNLTTTGSSNTASGLNALYYNTTGSSNTASGLQALYQNTTGSSNTASGLNALYSNTTGSSNTASGVNALASNTIGSSNTASGVNALHYNTTGSYNTAHGLSALYFSTTGSQNTANGFQALSSNTIGSSNTASGLNALASNTTGSYNTAYGLSALYSNTIGAFSTASGLNALYSNTTGSSNTANGFQALYSNTTGNQNTAIGYNTGLGITTGSNNTILGSNVTGLAGGLSNNIILADGVGNQRINVTSAGQVGLGNSAATATLHIKAGTAAAGTSPQKFTAGTLLTTPEAGAEESDASAIRYYTDGAATRRRYQTTNYTTLPSAITVGASPFIYQNTSGYDADVLTTGGTVTLIEFSRDGTTYYAAGITAGSQHLSPGDRLQITYTAAPTLTLIPR